MNGSNKRANHTALTQLTRSPKRDERDEVKGQDREHKGKSHLLLYPPSFANIPAHLSLDTLHFSPFDSDTIPNTMDLIPNSVCKKANKKTLAKTLIRKKKKKKKRKALITLHSKSHHLCLLQLPVCFPPTAIKMKKSA